MLSARLVQIGHLAQRRRRLGAPAARAPRDLPHRTGTAPVGCRDRGVRRRSRPSRGPSSRPARRGPSAFRGGGRGGSCGEAAASGAAADLTLRRGPRPGARRRFSRAERGPVPGDVARRRPVALRPRRQPDRHRGGPRPRLPAGGRRDAVAGGGGLSRPRRGPAVSRRTGARAGRGSPDLPASAVSGARSPEASSVWSSRSGSGDRIGISPNCRSSAGFACRRGIWSPGRSPCPSVRRLRSPRSCDASLARGRSRRRALLFLTVGPHVARPARRPDGRRCSATASSRRSSRGCARSSASMMRDSRAASGRSPRPSTSSPIPTPNGSRSRGATSRSRAPSGCGLASSPCRAGVRRSRRRSACSSHRARAGPSSRRSARP